MYLLTAPTTEPVTLAEAKLAARIDSDAFDAMVPGLITAARQMAEQETGRLFITQTWRTELVDWPAAAYVLPVHQATAATITYWNGAAWASLAGAAFVFGDLANGTALAPATGSSWPTLGDKPVGSRVRIDLTAGDEDATAVSGCVKLYIKALVSVWINNPDAAQRGAMQTNPLFERLLDRERLWH